VEFVYLGDACLRLWRDRGRAVTLPCLFCFILNRFSKRLYARFANLNEAGPNYSRLGRRLDVPVYVRRQLNESFSI
jgi:hypothetical protein